MKAHFEEKVFEQHLNNELLNGSHKFFPPGQVLENLVGYDVALHTENAVFWRTILRNESWFKEFSVSYQKGVFLEETENNLEAVFNDAFPPFQFNAFIQHKRPNKMLNSRAAEWDRWKKEYFRYDIVDHQQDILEKLESKIGDDGVVVYASPAFYKMEELWDAVDSRTVVSKTNFCQPHRLINHRRYTYTEAGSHGIAHSEPEEIQSKHFLEELERLYSLERTEVISNSEFLLQSCQIVESSLEKQSELKKLYFQILSSLNGKQIRTENILANFNKLAAFQHATGISILTAY